MSESSSDQQDHLRSLLQLKKKYDQPTQEEVPQAYKTNSDKENLYVWSARNFFRQCRRQHPRLRPQCLVVKNECGAEKLAPTFVRPTALPFSHLFSVGGCAQFVSDYVFYRPMAATAGSDSQGNVDPWEPPVMAASPSRTLATQEGNSLEMSIVLTSLLTGFGFTAYVVVGRSTRAVAAMDRSGESCKLLGERSRRQREGGEGRRDKYEAVPPPELKSKFQAFIESKGGDNSDAWAEDVEAEVEAATASDDKEKEDSSSKSSSLEQKSKKEEEEEGGESRKSSMKAARKKQGSGSIYQDCSTDEEGGSKTRGRRNSEFFHSWVYVQVTGAAFFVEPSTGERRPLSHPGYLSINCVFNQENYWLSREPERETAAAQAAAAAAAKAAGRGKKGGRKGAAAKQPPPISSSSSSSSTASYSYSPKWKCGSSLELGSNELWVKLVADLEETERKRLLVPLQSWVQELKVPVDCYELMYRLGQKTEIYHRVRVEYFAPYLMKEGTVQKVQYFTEDVDPEAKVTPPVRHVVEKFRHRKDRMVAREAFPGENRVVEKFSAGRPDRLREHERLLSSSEGGSVALAGARPTEYVSKFYSEARGDGLAERRMRELEITERYAPSSRPDGMRSMHVTFVIGEKKFGPAENSGAGRGQKEISRIVERYQEPLDLLKTMDSSSDSDGASSDSSKSSGTQVTTGSSGSELDDDDPVPGRVLNTAKVMERTFDLEGERILIKFHRESGQIFCKTVEFLPPKASPEDEGEPELTADDVKVFLVDPREERPSQRELELIYDEQVKRQEAAVAAVHRVEKEMEKLLEDRMRELSANEMEVWLYDVKRNLQVRRGRRELEAAARAREESVMDLEVDFLGPYLSRWGATSGAAGTGEDGKGGAAAVVAMSRSQVERMRDDGLRELRRERESKLTRLKQELAEINAQIEEGIPDRDEENSKRFFARMIESRLLRQEQSNEEYMEKAVKQWNTDPRIRAILN